MKKLTLSADSEVIEEAKRLSSEMGTSVSALFVRFIRALAKKNTKPRLGRLTRQATGLVKLPRGKNDRDIVAEALEEKYGFKK
jgi:hypothetical protein